MTARVLRAGVAVAATLAFICRMTLGAASGPGGFCLLICGDGGVAGFLLNMALYIPFGAALAALIGRVPRVALVSAVLSSAIEVAQHFLPGRFPSPGDVLANTLGASIGAAVWLALPVLLDPAQRIRSRLTLGAAVMAFGAPLVTALLLTPDLPRSQYWGQWAPRLAGLDRYQGRVDRVTLGNMALPDFVIPDTAGVIGLLRRGDTLRVSGIAGPATERLAPIFSIADIDSRTILQLGLDGADLVYRSRSVAAPLGFEQPELRARGWWRSTTPGTPTVLRVWRASGGLCLGLDTRLQCGFRYGAGSGWRFLKPAGERPSLELSTLDAIWLAMILFPLGLWTWGRRGATLVVVAVAFLGLVPLITSLSVAPTDLLGAVAGVVCGRLLRTGTVRRALRAGTRPA